MQTEYPVVLPDAESLGQRLLRLDPASGRPREEGELAGQIAQVHERSCQTYGSPRVFAALWAQGRRHGRNRVARLMPYQGLLCRSPRRFRPQTTDSRYPHPIAPIRLATAVPPSAPNRIWVGDITYPPPPGLALSRRRPGPLQPPDRGLGHEVGLRCGLGPPGSRHGVAPSPTSRRAHPLFRSRRPVCRRSLPRRPRPGPAGDSREHRSLLQSGAPPHGAGTAVALLLSIPRTVPTGTSTPIPPKTNCLFTLRFFEAGP